MSDHIRNISQSFCTMQVRYLGSFFQMPVKKSVQRNRRIVCYTYTGEMCDHSQFTLDTDQCEQQRKAGGNRTSYKMYNCMFTAFRSSKE